MWQEILKIENLLVVGLIIATFAAGVISAFLITRYRKRRLWHWSSVLPLVQENWNEKIIVQFDRGDRKEEIPNLYMCIIGLRYKGRPAIRVDDYGTPVTFDFGDAEVLDAEVFETEPRRMDAKVLTKADTDAGAVDENEGVKKNVAVLKPMIFTNKNQITARVLLTQPNPPTVLASITDVEDIQNEDSERDWPTILMLISAPLLIVVLAVYVITNPADTVTELTTTQLPAWWVLTPIVALAGLMFWANIWQLMRFRRRVQRRKYRQNVGPL